MQNEQKEENEENIHLEKIVDNTIHHKYMFRICLIGNICVGKTSLLARYADNSFKESYANTIGVDFRVITLKYKDIIAKVHIWDTAGNERFKSITINYYRSSHGFIYVYDITSKESFENLDMWINLTNENCGTNAINFLVGNKSDLEKEREVTKEEGEEFAKKYDLIFIETSAKNNDNVGKLFEFFTYKLIEYYQKNTDKYIGNNSDTLDSFSQFTNLEINDKKSGCQC
jgi:small GTP-binding protein